MSEGAKPAAGTRLDAPLTHGPVFQTLVLFALPLLLGNLFQQLYNTADYLIVGNLCSAAALAAVSSSNAVVNLLISASQGFAVGAGVVISRRLGENDHQGVRTAVHTTAVVGALLGVGMTLVSVLFAETVLRWIHTPESVMPESVQYFRIYSFGLFFLVMYNIGSGIFRAVGDNRRPLQYLMVASVLNIVLDLVFVAGLHAGVRGAAAATVVAQGISVTLEFRTLFWEDTPYRLRLAELRIDRGQLRQILNNALPGSLQNSIVSLSNVVVQANVNGFGQLAMAGFGAYNKLGNFAVLPAISISMSLTTFVSQNLGAGEWERARKGVRSGFAFAIAETACVGLLVALFAPWLIALFNHDAEVVRFGVMMARRVGPFLWLLGFSHALAGALRGCGLARVPMLVLTFFWCGLRVVWIVAMLRFVPDIRIIYWGYPLTWLGSALALSVYMKQNDWLHHTL